MVYGICMAFKRELKREMDFPFPPGIYINVYKTALGNCFINDIFSLLIE